MNQAAVSLGLVLAPGLATFITVRSGWRHAFIVTGALGLLWIPMWLWASRHIPVTPTPKIDVRAGTDMLRDQRLWIFVAANALSMIPYSLWTNWTTLYLVDVHHLTLVQAAWFAWIPPVFAALGGFAGGWLSLRWIDSGLAAPTARYRACLLASILALATAAIPAAPNPAAGSALISLSFLAVAAFSVNMYSLPLDTFGGSRAAFAVSMLTASAGAAGLVSPLIGKWIDLHGYGPVTALAAAMPLLGCVLLKITRSAS
jgi:ACS family hexuronate transporter-like MFS transporter